MIVLRLCLIISVIIIGSIFAGPNGNAKIRIDFNYQTPQIDSVTQLQGTTVTAAVIAEDVVNLDSYEFFLRFDPTILSYSTGAAEVFGGVQNIFRKNSSDDFLFSCGMEDGRNDLLTISNTLSSELDSVAAPDGSGLLALIMFDIVAPATCTLWLEEARFCDYEGDVNCEIISGYTNGVLDYALTPAVNTFSSNGRVSLFTISVSGVYNLQGRIVSRRVVDRYTAGKGLYLIDSGRCNQKGSKHVTTQ